MVRGDEERWDETETCVCVCVCVVGFDNAQPRRAGKHAIIIIAAMIKSIFSRQHSGRKECG